MIDSDIGGESTGPLLLAGGDGRDRISFFGDSDADISISGGPGDDTIAADAFRGQRGVGAPGPLRVRLKTTRPGRRRLRRDRDLKLYVFVRTRTGGDRGEVRFDSRIG